MEIECPNCKKILELPDNAVGVKVRCSFCRATFIGEEPAVSLSAPAGSGFKFCPNCGAKAVAGFKFCANCGQSFGASKPVKVASRAPSAMVDCVVCGKHMRESSAVKCPRCGNNVCKTHYNRKLDVCSQCVPDVMGELADKAVAVGESGDWTQALAMAKQCDKTDGRVLYVYAHAYRHWVPTIAYRNWEHNAQKFNEYLRASAIAGYAPAQFEMEAYGSYNFTALSWTIKAAEQEYVPAQMKIAKMAWDGYAMTNGDLCNDCTLAYKWYKRAAENGDIEACYRLAVCYLTGKGVAFDSESGLMWLRRASDAGHNTALCLLGHYYRTGRFLDRDKYKALDCYIKSADKGNDHARRYAALSHIRTNYVLVDLSDGVNAARFPVHEFDDEGSLTIDRNKWPETYKTRYLLLRRIEPGQCVNASGQIIKITKPFYLGVFPVTQFQWELVMGSRPSYFANEQCYKMRPVESVSYENVRGDASSYQARRSFAVDETSFLGVLRRKTSLEFELPTSCQWEFACRAGSMDNQDEKSILGGVFMFSKIAGYGATHFSDASNRNCDESLGTISVGSACPNRWGLYDMRGNVCEYCRDASAGHLGAMNVDLIGSNQPDVDVRGGSWCSELKDVSASSWRYVSTRGEDRSNTVGFRVSVEFVEWDCPDRGEL